MDSDELGHEKRAGRAASSHACALDDVRPLGKVSAAMTAIDATWESDFFGTVNDMPAQPVDIISQVLELTRAADATAEQYAAHG